MNIRLNKDQKIQVKHPYDIYAILRLILLRQQRIDRNREHFWTVGLAMDNSILFIELVSMGSINSVIVEPMEVFSFALQKRAVKLILAHNHPSGNLKPSKEDMDITDRLIQTGHIVSLPIIDHLIISETDYYSFGDSGLLAKLDASTKYLPAYMLAERHKEEGGLNKAMEMALVMKKEGYPIADIARITGLPQTKIKKLKN
ncbi:MAG TPA: JAB domain-containing protein [Edaphocola sp.]|nr:JAB domain-containing protein [Edaphocola sp.]